MDGEISQRIRSGWKAFIMLKNVLKAKLDNTQCVNLFNSNVLSAMLYKSKIWATMKKDEQKLVMTPDGYGNMHT